MAVTKRTRFEVLRRDGHACRYCHATKSPLTMDHVIPVSLGGSDGPENLVAACRDCNAGKSSATPDADLVAQVSEEALLHAQRIKDAYEVLREDCAEQEGYVEQFAVEFPGRRVPEGWKGSLMRWHEMGVPIEVVLNAGHLALACTAKAGPDVWFKYLAKVVWNKVGVVASEARDKAALDGAWMTRDKVDDVRCDSYTTGYLHGEADGRYQAEEEAFLRTGILGWRMLSASVDGLSPNFVAAHGRWAKERQDHRRPLEADDCLTEAAPSMA